MNQFIESQNWRYATKKFDATQKISSSDLDILKEAVRLTASSLGLQPYKVLIVENPDLRAQLQVAAFGQTQVVDASHLFVFASEYQVGETEIESYMASIASTRGINEEALAGFRTMVVNSVTKMDQITKENWTAKQVYLALGNLLNAAADLRIDATPMEGFNPSAVNNILGLQEKGLHAVALAALGYRHVDDKQQHLIKVRKSQTELFITL
jgi:nitroreductase